MASTPEGRPGPSAQADGPRVLVVDDDPIVLQVTRRTLERAGYRVDTAGDGAEALAWVRGTRFDAVLMDCGLPVVDGYEAASRIRGGEPEGTRMPIVALTGGSSPSDEARALAVGMDVHLSKPVDRAELLATLESLIGGGMGRPPPGRPIVGAPGRRLPIDPAVLAALERIDGTGAALRSLVERFVESGPQRYDQLASATAERDVEAVRRASHTLKGSAATFGAQLVAEAAAGIEADARLGVLPSPDALRSVKSALDLAIGDLVGLVDGMGSH